MPQAAVRSRFRASGRPAARCRRLVRTEKSSTFMARECRSSSARHCVSAQSSSKRVSTSRASRRWATPTGGDRTGSLRMGLDETPVLIVKPIEVGLETGLIVPTIGAHTLSGWSPIPRGSYLGWPFSIPTRTGPSGRTLRPGRMKPSATPSPLPRSAVRMTRKMASCRWVRTPLIVSTSTTR